MALETATTINGLVSTNPPSGDPLGEADDHIRLLKTVLKTTFDQDGGGKIRKVEWARFAVPIGTIVLWYGTAATIPAGWVACDGGTHTRSDGGGSIVAPDMRNRVAIHPGSTFLQGTIYGNFVSSATTSSAGAHAHTATTSSNGSHSHGSNTRGHAVTMAQMPAHQHGGGTHTHVNAYGGHVIGTTGWTPFGGVGSYPGLWATEISWSGTIIAPDGGNQEHWHGISADGTHAHTLTTTSTGAHTHSLTVSTVQPARGMLHIMKI